METSRGEGVKSGIEQGNDFPVPMFKHHLQPGLNKSRKNTSNTRSIYWSKKLITLWEGGLPYKLDALGLSTEGRSQLGGVLRETDPFSGSAVYDSKKDLMLFYSNKQDGGSSELTLYEFNAKFRVKSSNEFKLPGFALISGFTATEKYALFVQPPVSTNGMSFMLSKEPSKSLKVDKGPAVSFNGMNVVDYDLFDVLVDADGMLIQCCIENVLTTRFSLLHLSYT
jgi:carotenoid cleavage dioxygenase-like enzyme